MCLSIQQTGEFAQHVETKRMPELIMPSHVAQVENESRDTMESALPSTTWLRLGDWPQLEKQDSCSQTEEDLETAISNMQVKGC